MELQQIEYFLAVVDHDGVTTASLALGVSQPTISQAIRNIERELGAELFHRLGRGMTLTAAGRSLIGAAKQIVRDVAAAESLFPEGSVRRGARLDIMAQPSLAVGHLPRVIAAFRKARPEVVVRVSRLDEAMLPTLIADGHCELVYTYAPAPAAPGLELEILGEQEHWLISPPGSDVPVQNPLPIAALRELPMIVVPRGSGFADEIERMLSHLGGDVLRPTAVLESRAAKVAFVLAGIGSTLLEKSTAELAGARGAIVRAIDPPISRQYGVLYDAVTLSPAGRDFLTLAKEIR